MFQMLSEDVMKVQDLTAIAKVFWTDPDTIKKHLKERIYCWTGRALNIALHQSDASVISKAQEAARYVNGLQDDERRIFQKVLAHLSEKDGDII